MLSPTLPIAFVAGLVSFLSPCVLPIIPGFLAYLAGSSLKDASTHRRAIFLNSLLFVLGFSVIFAGLGVLLNSLIGNAAYQTQMWLARVGGVFMITFGLHLTGLITIPWLNREYKFRVLKGVHSQYLTSFIFGAAFAAGWTPCVGPVLGAILGLAAAQPDSAFFLLLSYSLGLGVPFLLVGLFTQRASTWIHAHGKQLEWVKILFGAILIVLGMLAFTNQLSLLASFPLLNKWLLK